jgi:hypothetical protein
MLDGAIHRCDPERAMLPLRQRAGLLRRQRPRRFTESVRYRLTWPGPPLHY